MNTLQHSKRKTRKVIHRSYHTASYMLAAKRLANQRLLRDEWLILLQHFYGYTITEGAPLRSYYALRLKDIETLIRFRTRMIQATMERKRKEMREKAKRDGDRLLEKLKNNT